MAVHTRLFTVVTKPNSFSSLLCYFLLFLFVSLSPCLFSNIKIANIPFPPGFLASSATKAVAKLVESEGTLSCHVRHNM